MRNEEVHIARCLDDLLSGGIDVILIDNGSEDETVAIARRYLGRGLQSIEHLPWRGSFSLREQLLLKRCIVDRLHHDWVLHADADEWLCAPEPGLSLSEAIERVDREGFTCINFEEIVFVPWPDEDFTRCAYTREMTTYYFFQPSRVRLERAWRRKIGADNVSFAGHQLRSEGAKLYPTSFVLRHYIALSHAHAVRKYVERRFDLSETELGWHGNRLALRPPDLLLRPSPHLRRLERWNSQSFDRSAPAAKHFWQWHLE